MKTQRFGLVLALAAFGASGCAAVGKSDFSCSGPTPGVSCLPAKQVYEISNDPVLLEKVTAALEAAAASGEEYDAQEIIAGVRATYKPDVEVAKAMAAPISQPMPVLKPAHVIRIWLDAWVDEKGDLHMPGYIFTEITPRRWSFGEPAVSQSEILAPVQVERGPADSNPISK